MSSKLKKIRRVSRPNRHARRRDTRSAGARCRLLTTGVPEPCNCPICAVMAQPGFADEGSALTDAQVEQLMAAFAEAAAREGLDDQGAFNRKMDAYVASVVGKDGDYLEYLLNTPDEQLTDTDLDVMRALVSSMVPDVGDGNGGGN